MCTVSVFNSTYMALSNWGNISLLVMCRKHALRIKYFRWAFSSNFVSYWIFFSVPTRMFFLHLFLFISFEYIPSSFLSYCCSAEVELNAL